MRPVAAIASSTALAIWSSRVTSICTHTARLPEPLDLGGDGRRARRVAQAEHDIGAGVRERQRNRLAEAASGAGHEGHAAAEVETRESDFGCRHAATVACAANWHTQRVPIGRSQSTSRQVSETCLVPNTLAGRSAATSSKPQRW